VATGVAGDTGVKEMTIEAIKEALDALEDLLYHDEEPDQRLGRAVYVLQEAVKEAEKQEPVAWLTKELMAEYIEAISTAIYRNQTGELTYIADKLRRGES
jgi:hypothetical protein